MADPNKGRIAIKFGGSSSASKPAPRPNNAPRSALGKRPRAGAWDSDSDPDDDERGRHEAITGFGADGAETAAKRRGRVEEKKEYIIQRQPNRDWRAEMKAQRPGRNLLPPEARAQQNGQVETESADQDSGIKWGLTVKEKKVKTEDDEDTKAKTEEDEDTKVKTEDDEDTKVKTEDDEESKDATVKIEDGDNSKEDVKASRTADDEAMDALLGRAPPGDAQRRTIVQPPSETDAFRRDMETAGEASTLQDYEDMPVEEFGAALLRGMGWNGEERGAKPREVKRRPNRLGLGAKELKGEEDLGGWNQNGGKKSKRPRLDEYRREENKRKEGKRNEDSYKRERERERERDGHRDRDRDRGHDRHRERHRDHHRDRRR